MNEIFQYFADVLLVTMRDALILLLDKFLKVKLGCSLVLAISVVCKELRETRADFVLSQSTRLFTFLPSTNQNAQNVKT